MSNRDPGRRLRGRPDECEALDRLVAGVRAGQSRVLVLRGEARVGKTASLDDVSTGGGEVARSIGRIDPSSTRKWRFSSTARTGPAPTRPPLEQKGSP